MIKLPELPKRPNFLPANPVKEAREVLRQTRQGVEKARDEIRSLADELKSTTGVKSPNRPYLNKASETIEQVMTLIQGKEVSESELRRLVEQADVSLSTAKEAGEVGEECKPCATLRSLKEYLGRRKVEKSLTELESGEGDREKNLERVRKYIEGDEVG